MKILRQEITSRGGGIEIDLTPEGYPSAKMTAYQNYLGGGLLGRVQTDCTISDYMDHPPLRKIAERLARYFHSLTNPSPEDQPWESQTFDQNQNMPTSGY